MDLMLFQQGLHNFQEEVGLEAVWLIQKVMVEEKKEVLKKEEKMKKGK